MWMKMEAHITHRRVRGNPNYADTVPALPPQEKTIQIISKVGMINSGSVWARNENLGPTELHRYSWGHDFEFSHGT